MKSEWLKKKIKHQSSSFKFPCHSFNDKAAAWVHLTQVRDTVNTNERLCLGFNPTFSIYGDDMQCSLASKLTPFTHTWTAPVYLANEASSLTLPSPGYLLSCSVPAQNRIGQLEAPRGAGEQQWAVPTACMRTEGWQGWLHTPVHTEHLADPKCWAHWQELPQHDKGRWHDHAVQLTRDELKGKSITVRNSAVLSLHVFANPELSLQ